MTAPTDPPGPPPSSGPMPTPEQAQALARDLLAGEGTRLQHVRTAGLVATRLSVLFDPEDAELLITAATLHDIGYSARIAHTGFHPLDGGAFLRAKGYPERLARLVAHHSLAIMTAPTQGIDDLSEQFPREDGLLADALAYADLHSAPDGRLIPAERRLADITRRHPDRADADRAPQLRAAVARVGAALLAAGHMRPGEPHDPISVPEARRLDQAGPLRPEASDVGSGYRSIARGGDRRPPVAVPVPDPVRSAFHSWWSAESQYSLAMDLYQAEDGGPGTEVREVEIRLVRLRARADSRRDTYFRAALG